MGKVEKFQSYLKNFSHAACDTQSVLFGKAPEKNVTDIRVLEIGDVKVKVFVNEFWTHRQRQANSIHEISYRACFKPQLPRFFIALLTEPGDSVYDPFAGRGTTAIETALLGRRVIANDINPLSKIFITPRLSVPLLNDVEVRLEGLIFDKECKADIDLSMFYHPGTEAEIVSLRNYLVERERTGFIDDIDRWIRMAATNRLTGHSPGFFSVYTLPPNQAASQKSQIKINKKRGQTPEYRAIKPRIMRKSKGLQKNISPAEWVNLKKAAESALLLTGKAAETEGIRSGSVRLTVTSPPFLNIVNYAADNWLRCWFNGYDSESIDREITAPGTVEAWREEMLAVFEELFRITAPGGWVAFEVGEVKNGKIKLDRHVVPLGIETGFECAGIVINKQDFTKTSNIWGVDNNAKGTNTNRIVVFHRPNA